jgi:hypothetical protein
VSNQSGTTLLKYLTTPSGVTELTLCETCLVTGLTVSGSLCPGCHVLDGDPSELERSVWDGPVLARIPYYCDPS